jgi:hypothetical protein
MIPEPHDESSDKPLSGQDVAVLYGISLAHVRLLAISRRLGDVTDAGELVFSADEIAALRPRGYGRPWMERDTTWGRRP